MRKAGIALAVAAFVIGLLSTGQPSTGMVYASAWLACMLLVILVRKRWRDAAYLMSGMRKVDAMSGTDFENYVAAKFRSAGYRVSLKGGSGDFGVDLIARKGGDRIAIQCKRHGRPVGTSAVQQVVAGAALHGCTSTMVVSNQEFTPGAVRLARIHKCKLVGRSRLQLLPV